MKNSIYPTGFPENWPDSFHGAASVYYHAHVLCSGGAVSAVRSGVDGGRTLQGVHTRLDQSDTGLTVRQSTVIQAVRRKSDSQ